MTYGILDIIPSTVIDTVLIPIDLTDKRPGSQTNSVTTEAQAIHIAGNYVHKDWPDIDISQKPPTAEFGTNAPAQGRAVWTVKFAYPAPRDPSTGKPVGFRPFWNLDVWVSPNGTVLGTYAE